MFRCWGLIPARGGSKGIPRKNLREVDGKPLIAYTITQALAANTLERVIVSTDDMEIAEVAKEYGADVPFLRPQRFAEDSSSDHQVIQHLADWAKCQGQDIDSIAYLRPTTPLKTSAIIDEAVSLLDSNSKLSGVRSVTPVEGVFHPYWMFRKGAQGVLHNFVDGASTEKYYQRQLLPPCYRLNGVCDVLRRANLEGDALYGEQVGAIEVTEEMALDIDTELDLRWFEFLVQQKEKGR